MNKQHSGFTLIELVVVIVILGILAATALPKFVDLSTEAKTAKAQGVAGAISANAAMTFAKTLAGGGSTASATAAGKAQCALGSVTGDTSCTSATLSGTTCTVTCDGQTATAAVNFD